QQVDLGPGERRAAVPRPGEERLQRVADLAHQGNLRGARRTLERMRHPEQRLEPLGVVRRGLQGEEIRVHDPELLLELRQEGGEEPPAERVARRHPRAAGWRRWLPPTSSMSRAPSVLRSCAARSVCRVEARVCWVASWMLAIACRIWDMPIACCPAEATIWAAACAASEIASPRV